MGRVGLGLTGFLVMAAIAWLPGQAAKADGLSQTNTQSVLLEAFRSFENSASRDPISQQRIISCLADQAQKSDTLAAYSDYDPKQWSQIDTKGLDLSSVVAGINSAIDTCEGQLDG